MNFIYFPKPGRKYEMPELLGDEGLKVMSAYFLFRSFHFCEILLVEAKKVLLNIISITCKKNLINHLLSTHVYM